MLGNLYLESGTLGIPSGGGGCAAHVPPRCRGETKSRSKWQRVVKAFIQALCDEMRGAIKSIAKHVPEAHQNPVRGVPKFFKIEAWDGPGRQNAAPNLPRAAKRRPRASKKCSRDAQEAPKRGQEPSKSEQKPAKWRLRVGQTLPESTPRRVSSTIFAGSYERQPPATLSRRFVAGAQSVQCVKTIQQVSSSEYLTPIQ